VPRADITLQTTVVEPVPVVGAYNGFVHHCYMALIRSRYKCVFAPNLGGSNR
jgi:hypothetical protein